jgi:hypothetical protein
MGGVGMGLATRVIFMLHLGPVICSRVVESLVQMSALGNDHSRTARSWISATRCEITAAVELANRISNKSKLKMWRELR